MYKHVIDTSVRAKCPGSPGNHERLDMPTIYCAEMYANYNLIIVITMIYRDIDSDFCVIEVVKIMVNLCVLLYIIII